MKITIIFPARDLEIGKATMPVAPTLLAALTPQDYEISLIDMFYGDEIDYATGCDLVAITVRTPLAVVAYNIADKFVTRGKTVVLGGPHIFAYPNEAKQHAAAVAIGEGEQLWPMILEDFQADRLKDYYVCGPYKTESLNGGESIVFKHPTMSSEEMYEMNAQVLHEGYSMGRVLARTFHTVKKRPSLGVAMNSFFTQTSLKKSFREQFKGLKK